MITAEQVRPRTPLLLVLVCFGLVQGCFLFFPQLFEPWSQQATDALFRLRAAVPAWAPHYDDTVVHVDLTDSSLRQLGELQPTRAHHALAIRNLGGMGVAAQAYDFIFAGASDDEADEALRAAAAEAGNVYFGLAARLDGRRIGSAERQAPRTTGSQAAELGWKLPAGEASTWPRMASEVLATWRPIAAASRGLGMLNVTPDPDGVVRRIPLLVLHEGQLLPTLALRLVADQLGVSSDRIALQPGGSVTLLDASSEGAGTRDLVIPTDAEGNLVLNYIGPWERMTHYDFADIVRAADDRFAWARWSEELAGKIVLVSDITTGSVDVGPVPTDSNFPLSGVHAAALHDLLTGRFLRAVPAGAALLLESLLALAVGLLALRLRGLPFVAACLGFALITMAAASGGFLFADSVVDPVRPLLFLGASAALVMTYRVSEEEREKEILRRTCDAYFPPSVIEKVMKDPDALATSAKRAELSILFSDIEDFTRHSAIREPAEIRAMLNEYFEAMTEIAFSHGGTIDKFIGDAVMVFFGDPEHQPDHALRCVRTAIEMQSRIAELRTRWAEKGWMPLRVRIGVNTGEVVVGNLGSARRLVYTATGSPVNLAQRLESKAPADGILISRRTADLVNTDVPLRPVDPIQVKGFDDPVEVYEILLEP